MKRSDVERLRKLLNMTTSANDSEALAAMRHANRLLTTAGVSWDRLFDRLMSSSGPYAGATVAQPQGPRPPGPAYAGGPVESAEAYTRPAAGFGRDADPSARTHDEPSGAPEDYDGPSGYDDESSQQQQGGPVVDKELEQQLVEIVKCFEVLDRVGVPEEAQAFIDSLRKQFKRKGSLSEKQIGALNKFKVGALKRENGRG